MRHTARNTSHPPRAGRHRSPRVIGALIAAALFLAGCGGTTGAPETSGSNEDAPLVYGAYATPLEEPWDGAIHAALTTATEEGKIRYKHVDNLSTSDAMERSLRDIAQNERPDAIVGDAFAAEEAVRKVAKDFPEIVFAFGSGEEPQAPNLSVFDNWMQDPAYLAGMLSGGTTETDTIGVVGAMPIPEVNRIVNGYIAGVKVTNPDATVKVSFINSFFDPAAAKQAAEAQISAGADVLFAERAGVVDAAKEADVPVIGMMVDQKDDAPQHVLTSLVWDVGPTIEAIIKQISQGPSAEDLGEFSFLKSGGSSITDINTDVPLTVSETLIDQVNAMQEQIELGDFTTPVDETSPKGSVDVSK